MPGTRGIKAEPVEGEHRPYSFLTCEPNAEVKPIHPKAMPVILTTAEEYDTGLNAPMEEALNLQRPLPEGAPELRVKFRRGLFIEPDSVLFQHIRKISQRPD
ncbi:SOS response-associated peptidase family protein [Microvirga rosea]|uniref:hypothetical protein n=1 Tax=Microvirga rosea TaxID=2715425 RepID=UPI00387313A4